MEAFKNDYFIRLTVAVYKVVDLLPEGEPLKGFIKQKAGELLGDFVAKNYQGGRELNEKLKVDWGVLKVYFELAKTQKWVKEENFDFLSGQYEKLVESFYLETDRIEKKEVAIQPKAKRLKVAKVVQKEARVDNDLGNSRHQKIVEILKSKGTVQVKDVKDFFPQLSKRTLRRDFEFLLQQGVVNRIGEGNLTVYNLK
ncbi:MAG: DeoR family transcriptional regulator [Candidatus Gribaldobacteria bacterium]|nr:DeoR family transcriptional regulator [Candidatus Gribaldobacteria bacterium]